VKKLAVQINKNSSSDKKILFVCLFISLFLYIYKILVIKTYVKVKNLDLIENISFIHSAYIYIFEIYSFDILYSK